MVKTSRLCADVNENYRGYVTLTCSEGTLLSDVGACRPQWVQVSSKLPLDARSQHTSVSLSDNTVLILGGYSDLTGLNDVWFWRPFDVTVRSEDGFRDGALGSTLEAVDNTGGG